jgi:hypothetical protein
VRGHEQARAATQVVHGGLGDDAAVGDHGHAVADLLDLGHEVAGQDDGAALASELDHQRTHVAHAGRVEPVGRLVEHDQLGILEQRGRDAESLLHAERIGREAIATAAGQVDRGERGIDAVGRHPGQSRDDPEVVAARQVGVEGRPLDHGSGARER